MIKLASQLDAVSSKATQAVQMQNVAKNIQQTNAQVNAVLKTINTEEVDRIFNDFQTSNEQLERSSAYMTNALQGANKNKQYDHEAMQLINQISDSMNIEAKRDFPELHEYNQKYNPNYQQQQQKQQQQPVLLEANMATPSQNNPFMNQQSNTNQQYTQKQPNQMTQQSIEERFARLQQRNS
eukprot:CAMPEP_0117425838 /NCGR_PEP_ID=MMETSP0758-20121206/6059_1 /TAXON_ID=63605 /ORGANISM="Percolomonas cosmopolitus, Strain AE-1 (ATCC 50343)" /LENGTH=181 /DNA_ID=CAMNT_0005210621 /DNA_START=191 /DNA_END=736 /DNA_ORIENTATION=-